MKQFASIICVLLLLVLVIAPPCLARDYTAGEETYQSYTGPMATDDHSESLSGDYWTTSQQDPYSPYSPYENEYYRYEDYYDPEYDYDYDEEFDQSYDVRYEDD